MPPINAGDLRHKLRLQTVTETIVDGDVTPSWSDLVTEYGNKRVAGPKAQLASEQAYERHDGEIVLRRRALPTQLRVLHGTAVHYVTRITHDPQWPDQTLLWYVDAIDLALGEVVTVYRATELSQADGSTLPSWSAIATDVRIRMDEADGALLQRVFGRELDAHVKATGELDCGVRLGDGIAVTTGRHEGQRYLVTGRVIDPTLPAAAYLALALTATDAPFTEADVDGDDDGGVIDGGVVA